MSRSIYFLALFVLFRVELLRAHQDTPLSFSNDKIEGLPAEYNPARFDKKTHTLTIGENSNSLDPLFFERFFFDPHDLQFAASWYHGEEVMPLYLVLRVNPKDKDYFFRFYFELKTAKLFDVQVCTDDGEGLSTDYSLRLPEVPSESSLRVPLEIK